MGGDYKSALQAAGAIVHAYKHFGDWQGCWYAYVTFDGETGFTGGSYGSCSGCDAFEGEFGYYDEHDEDYEKRLADFGLGYLDCQLWTSGQLIARLTPEAEWDAAAEDAIEWVRSAETGSGSGKLN